MAKSSRFPDRANVAILGDGLSGLVAGAVLSRAGKRVALFPDPDTGLSGEGEVPFYSQKLLSGFERDSPAERVLNELGISLSLLRRSRDIFKSPPAWLQVAYSDFRLTQYGDRAETLTNLRAGFGESAETVGVLYRELDRWSPLIYPFLYDDHCPAISREKGRRRLPAWLLYRSKVFRIGMTKASDYCLTLGLKGELQEYFNALSLFQTGEELSHGSQLKFFQSLDLYRHDPLETSREEVDLKDLLTKIIRQNKGEIVNQLPESLMFEGGRIAGLQFQGREGLGCDALVWNPRAAATPQEDNRVISTFYFQFDDRQRPAAMGDHLILKRNPDLPFGRLNFLYISLTDSGEADARGEKKESTRRGLTVQCPMPPADANEDSDAVVREITERLIWLMPFADESLRYRGRRLRGGALHVPSLFPKVIQRKLARTLSPNGSPARLANSVYYLPRPATPFMIDSNEMTSGYELAQSIKGAN
jgi:hypothetical protein